MTPREVVLEQIHHRQTAAVPYTLAWEEEVGTRLDSHFGSAVWRERPIPYIRQCGGVTGSADVRLDATHHRDAFGTVWRSDKLPNVVVEPGLKVPSFAEYSFPAAEAFLNDEEKQRTAAVVAQVGRESFTILNCPLCLWSTWYVRGFETTLMDCVAEEGFYEELLERMTVLTLDVIAAGADIPADAIMMGDDWGDQRGILIGPERWRRLFKPRYARIFAAIHAQGKLAIMHCCGSAADVMGDVAEIGLDVLESVQPEAAGMNPYALKAAWGDRLTFWGCLGSQSTIPFGTPEQIRAEIRRLRREMSRGGGFILAPAKPLRPETPTANAAALVEEFLAG